jgi:endonuclease-3 related protein
VDAYAKRIFFRHGLINENASYDDVQRMVHKNFEMSEKRLNQFHALLVETAKNFCKKRIPMCAKCPLGGEKHKKG